MKIIIVHKNFLQNIPPLLSVACILSDLGHSVHIYTCGLTVQIESLLQEKGITYTVKRCHGATSIIGRLKQYLQYRFFIKKELERQQFDYLWIEDPHCLRSLGSFIKRYKYIIQISELYEESKALYKVTKKFIYDAQCVFMPEYNRCCFYQILFHLKERPIVLENKPYFIPSIEEMKLIEHNYKLYLEKIRGKKVILYQGRIHKERDLMGFVKATALLSDDYAFVIMGKDSDGMMQKYKEANPHIIHIDFIPAPDYLVITSHAHIGILSYDYLKLNTAYCAPNKIFEYGAFKIPMLGNNIPGLKVLEYANAGLTVDEKDPKSIVSAIQKIENNYDSFSHNSYNLYTSTDNYSKLKDAIKGLG